MKKFNTLLLLLLVNISFGQVVSKEKLEFDIIYSQVNNINKWGADDKLGTINYITNQKVLSALKIPSKGTSVSLAFNMVVDRVFRLSPYQRKCGSFLDSLGKSDVSVVFFRSIWLIHYTRT